MLAETTSQAPASARRKEPKMTTNDAPEDGLDDLESETVEDLDVDEDADDVAGGTTWTCPTA